MIRFRYVLGVLLAAAAAVGAVALVRGRGVAGEAAAAAVARAAMERLGYAPLGEPDATFEGDQELAWALERARPGPAGAGLARGEGGAVRWRLVFPGGGEAQVTVDGIVWSLRRPVPAAPGPDLFPSLAKARVEAAVAQAVPDPSALAARARSELAGGRAHLAAGVVRRRHRAAPVRVAARAGAGDRRLLGGLVEALSCTPWGPTSVW